MPINSESMTKYIYKPKNCPPNNVLYRITFKYKTNFSGNKLFNLTRKNFPDFVVDIPNRQLRPGDSVRYTPLNKNDPNNGKLAMITSENNRRRYGKIVKTFDLEFISPTVRGNKVINNVQSIPQDKDGIIILTLIPQVSMYRCSSPFVPMPIINGYLTAYKNYNAGKTNRLLRVLERRGMELFDNYFHLGNNNEPLYPEFVSRGQPNFDLQQRMKTKMNREVEKMVNNSFLSGSKNNKPIIKGKSLEFSVPKDARGGKLVAINVDGININIRVPIGSKSLDRITVPIERSNNEAVYEGLKPSSKKESHIAFIPMFITAKFSNDKHLDIHKLVKASKNQSFKIKDASIIKQNNGANFKFVELARFNKTNNPLVFDLEVHVDLKLEVSKSSGVDSGGVDSGGVDSGGVTSKILNGIGDMIQNSGNGCPSKMRKLKQSMKNVSSQMERSRSTRGERSNRTKRRRRDERKRGKKTFNTKRKKIMQNRTRGKRRKYSVKKIFKTRTGYKKKRRSVRI